MHNTDHFFDIISRQIPLLTAMGMDVVQCDKDKLVLKFPIANNINDKGTGFAGSLNAATTFCAWAAIKLLMLREGLDHDLAVVSSQSEYKKPVIQNFTVQCQLPPSAQIDAFLNKLKVKGKASLKIESLIKQNGQTAVLYQGTYVAFPRQEC